MPNPIAVNISVTQANVTLFILADTYADFLQQPTIRCPDERTLTVTGSGEGRRIGFWKYPIKSVGIYTFNVYLQYDDGKGWKPSRSVTSSAFSALTLHETVVFSEDMGDNDMNDCMITFMWFSSGSAQ